MTNRMDVFAELLEEHHRSLFAFVYSLVQNHADAEDVYQQAALVMWRKFDDFQLGTNFRAWAAQIARNTARDFLKTKRRRAPCFSEEFLESMAAAYTKRDSRLDARRMESLERCLQKLPHRDRDLIELCYTPNRNIVEIATSMNRSVDAIYQAMSRIRKNLFRCIQRSLSAEE